MLRAVLLLEPIGEYFSLFLSSQALKLETLGYGRGTDGEDSSIYSFFMPTCCKSYFALFVVARRFGFRV
jgi:hypothetical protein